MPQDTPLAMLILLAVMAIGAILIYSLNQSIRTIINKGFSIATTSWPVVLLIFVFSAIFNVINLFLAPQAQGPTPQGAPMMIGIGIVFILITIFMQAGSIGYVRDRIKLGKASMSGFAASGTKYYLPLLLLSLVIFGIVLVFGLLSAVVVAALGQGAQAVAMGLVLLLLLLGGLAVLFLFFAPYIAIGDDKGVVYALSNSPAFVGKNFLGVIGMILVLLAVGFALGVLLGVLVGVTSRGLQSMPSQITFTIAGSFLNAILGLFVTSSFMGFYLSRKN